MKLFFGDIVVVENNQIGVVVKSWIDMRKKSVRHEIYVRSYNSIKEYKEEEIERFGVRHKYLEGDDIEYQYNAINNL